MEIKELQDKYLGLLKQVEEVRAPYDGKEAPPEEVKTNMNALLDEADKLQDEIKAEAGRGEAGQAPGGAHEVGQ